jgi:hypothetical protein
MGKLGHALKEASKNAAGEGAPRRVRRFFAELGPGLITVQRMTILQGFPKIVFSVCAPVE